MDFHSFLSSMRGAKQASPGQPQFEKEKNLNGAKTIDSPTEQTTFEQLLATGANKSASDALVAAGKSSASKGSAPPACGHAVEVGSHVTVDLDGRPNGAPLSQMEGATITHIATGRSSELRKVVAVNDDYITYGLPKGQIRVLHRHESARALLKKHVTQLVDLRFFSGSVNDLASTDSAGKLVVWRLAFKGAEEVQVQTLLCLALQSPESVRAGGITWHPQRQDLLAVAAHSRVLVCSLDAIAESGSREVACASELKPLPPGIAVLALDNGHHSHSLAFSPSGEYLVSGSSQGQVAMATTPDWEDLSQSTVSGTATIESAITSITWLTDSTLLLGSRGNAELQIWTTHHSEGLQHQQTLSLQSQQPQLNNLAYDAHNCLLLLGNAEGSMLVALHLAAGANRFDSYAQFEVTIPIVSLEARSLLPGSREATDVQVYAVQTTEIRQFTLQPRLCWPPSVGDSQQQDALPTSAAIGSAENPSTLHDVFGKLALQATSSPAREAAERRQSATAELLSGKAPLAVSPPQPSPQPANQLLTPTQLMQATRSTLPRSASEISSVMEVDGAARQPSAAFSAGLPYPSQRSSTPEAERAQNLQDAQQGTEVPGSGAEKDEPQEPSVSGAAGDKERGAISTPEAPGSQEAPASFTGKAETSSPAPASSSRKRRLLCIPATGVVDVPNVLEASMPVPVTPPAESQEQQPAEPSGQATPSSNAPQAAPAATSDRKQPAVADMSMQALLEGLKREQKKMVKEMQASQQATIKAVREESRQEIRRLEASADAQVTRLLEAQLKVVGEERKALVEQERQSIQRLLTTISASVNRDLPKRIEEITVREVAAVSAMVAQAVEDAVARTLSKELLGASVRESLEGALQGQLRTALTKPMQDNFRTSFQELLLPSFEGACQSMFSQVQATFAGGLAEHLQAAGGANAGIAASLRDSISQANAVANKLSTDVAQGYQQLLELASAEMRGQQEAASTALQVVPAPVDLRAEASRLLQAQQYEEAFNVALNQNDVALVAWICSQIAPYSVLGASPPLLSQHTLLSLLHHLGHDFSQDKSVKVTWIKEIAGELETENPDLAFHIRSVAQSVLTNLQAANFEGKDAKAARYAMAILDTVIKS